MKKIYIALFFLCGCAINTAPNPAILCNTPGTILSAEIPKSTRGYAYPYKVYLPPCFSANSEYRYPILYLIPGRGSTPDSWVAAGLADVVDQMIINREIQPFIIVFTENIESDPMADMIYKELIPLMEAQYPVVDDRKYRAVAGGSLGGIAAYRLAFQYPNKFSSAGIFGAGAVSGEEPRIRMWLSAIENENSIRLFMDTGDEDPLMLERAKALKSILDDMNIETKLNSSHGGHNYNYWISNFQIYLHWLEEGWK